MGMKGVSPLVSSLILVLIVLGVGSALVAYASSALLSMKQRFFAESSGEVYVQTHDLTLLATYINSSTLYILLATGGTPAVLQSVYINGSDYTSRCVVLVNGVVKSIGTGLYVPSESFVSLVCPISSGASIAYVRVVYDGGWVVGYAKRIG